MEKSVLIEIRSLICTSAIWGQYPLLSHPESFRCTSWGMMASVANCKMAGILFLSWVPSGLTVGTAVMWWFDGCKHHLLIWQATFFFFFKYKSKDGLPRWLSGKESACQCRRCEFSPWAGKILWRRKWQPTIVFLPGKSPGQRGLMGYSPWCCKRVRHCSVTKY